jgi:proline iminopeptidase
MTLPRQQGQSRGGLYWLRIGEGAEAVVLHGGPGADHGYLLPQFEQLADERALLFYDQRGGGRSRSGTPRPSWQDHVADLEALRQERALGPLTLVGYSWGGLLALLYALERPAAVARLALCSPAAPVHSYRAEMQATLRARSRRPEAERLRGFPRAVAGYFADPRRASELTPFRVESRAERSVLASLGNYDLRPRLGEIDVPLLVLHGTEDPIPLQYSEELARLAPRGRLVALPGCGHVPYVECPDRFFPPLQAFLREL